MAVQHAFMLIADIGGYTRFMKSQRTSLVHAHDIIARLLEAMIDATAAPLTLAKLEGDAAFFYAPFRDNHEADLSFAVDAICRMHAAFHQRIAYLMGNRLCKCDGCTQATNLKVKFAGHFGEAAIHKIKRMTELAGVDVILVHRILKNSVPLPEYFLMTESVLARLDERTRHAAASIQMTVDELGEIDAHYVDMHGLAAPQTSAPRRSLLAKLKTTAAMELRSLPYFFGLKKPCAGCRNLPDRSTTPA